MIHFRTVIVVQVQSLYEFKATQRRCARAAAHTRTLHRAHIHTRSSHVMDALPLTAAQSRVMNSKVAPTLSAISGGT